MIKRLENLDREENILLDQAIVAGKIDKNCLYKDTLVCTEYKDYFLGLMIASSPGNKEKSIICLGEAQKAKGEILKNS